jgi:hypothetical protein
MDRYDASGDLNDLRQSRDLYVEAFEAAQDDYYTPRRYNRKLWMRS